MFNFLYISVGIIKLVKFDDLEKYTIRLQYSPLSARKL